jgi:hypothetical protein
MSGFLLHDHDLVLDGLGIVRANLDVETIFERRDDAAARGVVLGIRARHEHDVDRQPNLVPFDLDVLLFHQVEESDLHFLGQIGQLVDGEDAAIGTRDQAVVDRLLVGEIASLGHFDRIDLSNQVRDGNVGRRELFGVSGVASDPCNLERVALLFFQLDASAADRCKGIVADFASGYYRHVFVEQSDQGPDDSRLRLPALTEENHVMAREHAVFDLRNYGLFVADDSR